ncbi:hypothetical protein ALQ33_01064 [Pseudomonas syringae pv. philadelphi]|uniref:Uncharacterized protein n=1 Tax=Pseudomonas syringae pv. philadelphi TaxID=251706 RepID=A0A3M3ZHH6_9PSED|nr:hypothetical protein [Pseudomonas syringae group genomosp. 3]RMO93515.1 hypothetical protein ALQ33_01064 [Pseudomonas syringae pv. philadelphi]
MTYEENPSFPAMEDANAYFGALPALTTAERMFFASSNDFFE